MCVPPLHLPSQAGLTPPAQLLRKLEAHRSNADLLHWGGAKATAGSLQGSCDGFATEEGLLCDFTPLSPPHAPTCGPCSWGLPVSVSMLVPQNTF